MICFTLAHGFLYVALLSLSYVWALLQDCPDPAQAEFDFIVVGAGAGGGPLAARLAESGFSVLVVDAGHDVDNLNTTIPLYFARATDGDPQLELNYTLDEYPPGFTFQKNNGWYPRARGIGGSALHNALINIIADTQNDFDTLSATFNDSTWSRDNMQEYFKLLENNLYLPQPNPDHGFDGWLKTSLNPDQVLLNPMFIDLELVDLAATITASGLPILDLNSRAGDGAIGVNAPSFTIDENHNRSSVRERLLDVEQSSAGNLQFSLDTLATKVLLCNGTDGTPTAFGVVIAPGAALAVASNFGGKEDLNTKNITAKYEVIISAGVFQSPQLLMLSGIGDSGQLNTFGIDAVVHLPGVGMNLQDHDEIAIIWHMKQNFSLFDGCTFLSNPAEDPCLAYWIESDHLNLYSFGGTLDVIISQSSPNLTEPDILTYFGPASFPGFVRGFAQEIADTHNAVSAVALKAHSSSRGTVQLTGSHPQDLLNIQKFHFQAPGGPQDVADLRDAIKRARAVMSQPEIALFVEAEVFPGPQAQTDEQIEAHVYENIFGHHACCTNAIGPDDDENAVLDGNFKVRGVNNLRVVDASSWPNVPGYFITTLIYMISEKAADVIIGAVNESL